MCPTKPQELGLHPQARERPSRASSSSSSSVAAPPKEVTIESEQLGRRAGTTGEIRRLTCDNFGDRHLPLLQEGVPRHYSGQSFRRDRATWARQSRIPDNNVRLLGRQKSNGYVEVYPKKRKPVVEPQILARAIYPHLSLCFIRLPSRSAMW